MVIFHFLLICMILVFTFLLLMNSVGVWLVPFHLYWEWEVVIDSFILVLIYL